MDPIQKLLSDYLAYLEIEKNRTTKTRENYEHYLNEFIAFGKIRSVKDITESVVRDFRLALARRSIGEGGRAQKNHAKLLRHRPAELSEISLEAGYQNTLRGKNRTAKNPRAANRSIGIRRPR